MAQRDKSNKAISEKRRKSPTKREKIQQQQNKTKTKKC